MSLFVCVQWEYERLTQKYWEHLIYEVSESGNLDIMLKKHPMEAGMCVHVHLCVYVMLVRVLDFELVRVRVCDCYMFVMIMIL